jgi:hypothetical protein
VLPAAIWRPFVRLSAGLKADLLADWVLLTVRLCWLAGRAQKQQQYLLRNKRSLEFICKQTKQQLEQQVKLCLSVVCACEMNNIM